MDSLLGKYVMMDAGSGIYRLLYEEWSNMSNSFGEDVLDCHICIECGGTVRADENVVARFNGHELQDDISWPYTQTETH